MIDNMQKQKPPLSLLKRLNSPQHRWITQQSRTLFDLKHSNSYIGPGSYNITNTNPNDFHSNKHSLFNSYRLCDPTPILCPQRQSREHSPGPGAYDIAPVNKQKNGVIWHKPIIWKRAVKQSQKLSIVEDKQQEHKSTSQRKRLLSSFASKIMRFPSLKNGGIGPGSYEISNNKHSPHEAIDKKKKRKTLMEKTVVKKRQKKKDIGPTSYDLGVSEMGSRIQKKGYAVLRESRFNYKRKIKEETPGPGHYCMPRIKPSLLITLLNRRRVKTEYQSNV